MNFLTQLSDFAIPLLIFYVVGFGLLMKVNIYSEFVKGAEDGFKTVIGIMPTLIGLMVGVGILRASGFLDLLSSVCAVVTDRIHFPSELVPLAIIKMFSSSAATSLVVDIFKEYGSDSFIGTITSLMMSCTETVFYTMSVYFLAAGVKKTRYTLAGALFASLAGIVASVVLAGWM